MDLLNQKLTALEGILAEMGAAAVAFSAGVDSTFLLYTAHRVLGDHAIAVTARSAFFPEDELEESESFCARYEIRQVMLDIPVLHDETITANPPDRCYWCKRMIFTQIQQAAHNHGINVVAEGSNADDTGDYRPGMRAVRELGVRSPLLEANLSKAEIRTLSRQAGLPTWDKPSLACLASRFEYGKHITAQQLDMVARAERFLRETGLRQVRVRVHDYLARIEVSTQEMPALLQTERLRQIDRALREIGFAYVALDLGGYRTGNMNRILPLRKTEYL